MQAQESIASEAFGTSQRDFIRRTGAAALAGLASQAELSATTLKRLPAYRVPAPSNELFLRYTEDSDEVAGEWIEGFSPTLEKAREYDPSRIERAPFRPLDSDARFIVAFFEWNLPSPYHIYANDKTPSKSLMKSYHAERGRLKLPSSLVELPPGFSGMCCIDASEGPVTLAAGLDRVAELNRIVAEEEGGALDMKWHGLVEIGKPVSEWRSVHVAPNGIGEIEKVSGDPCRVYWPTTEERARYPITWETWDDDDVVELTVECGGVS